MNKNAVEGVGELLPSGEHKHQRSANERRERDSPLEQRSADRHCESLVQAKM